jgi:predicted amidohydrolase
MAGCSQARNTEAGGYISYGHSIIVSPWGEVLAQMDEKEGMIVQEIDLSATEKIREQLPVLRQRRTDLYG